MLNYHLTLTLKSLHTLHMHTKPERVGQRDVKPSRNVKQTKESMQGRPRSDIMDTAKLVATCTAAATAALLHASIQRVRA